MSAKTPLLLLHGALGNKEQFEPLKRELGNSFEVFTLNFEGHGGRSTDRDFSMENFIENVLELMEQENLSSANFFGFSMGGYVALNLALKNPGKVERIMTLGTKFEWSEQSAHLEVSRLNPLKIEEKVPQFARELEKRHAPFDWHQVLSKTGEMILALGKSQAIFQEDFEQVKCPVLIARGSEDNMVSEGESMKIADIIPEAEFYTFEGFKHPLEQVDVSRLSRKIKKFAGLSTG